MRGGFLLDPEVAYFNHGGYGACRVEVFDEYQRLQRELEHAPTEFFMRVIQALPERGRIVGVNRQCTHEGRTSPANRLHAERRELSFCLVCEFLRRIEHRVEVPVYEWEETTLLRVSIGPYNDDADVARLVDAVRETLSRP